MAVRGSNSLFFSTGMDNSGLQQGVDQALGMVQGLSSSIAAINPFAAFGAAAAAAFAAISASAHSMMRNFEQAMKEVETISAATQENFDQIASSVFQLSKISPDAPEELAKAYYQIVSAGYDGAKGLKLLETATKAATAGVTNTKAAADGITTALNAFNLEAEKAAEVSDAFFTTVRLGKTTFEELSQDLSQAAPIAAAYGYSLEEVLAAVATLTKQGVPTNRAMTQIRSAIEAAGEVMGDGASEALTLQGTLQALYKQAGGSKTELRQLVGRVEAVSAVLGVAGKNADGATQDLKELYNSAGAATEAFDRMAESNVNQWKILGNRINATMEELGNGLVELSSGMAKFLNDAMDGADELTESFDKQRIELLGLERQLNKVEEGSQEWKDLRDEIIEQYPDFVGGIDEEKTSTEELLGVLEKVNEAYMQRYMFESRQKEIKEELEKQGNLQIELDKEKVQFDKLLDELRLEAKKRDITLDIDWSMTRSELLQSIRDQLQDVEGAMSTTFDTADKFDVKVEGFADKYLSGLSQVVLDTEHLNAKLKEQDGVIKELMDSSKRLTKIDLRNAQGRAEALKKINEAMRESDIEIFKGSGIKEIEDAIKKRMKVIEQFRTIDQAENIKSLEPFLNHEIEEVKKYAERMKRLLNDTWSGAAGGGGLEKFQEHLKDTKKQYEEYEAFVKQVGKSTADEHYKSLLEQGENYGEFLKKMLDETDNFVEQREIALAAEKSGLRLERQVQSVLGEGTIKQQKKIVDVEFKVNEESIAHIESVIDYIEELIRNATEEERIELAPILHKWRDKLKAAKEQVEGEKDLFEDIQLQLKNLDSKALQEYQDYWKKRAEEAEKGSKAEADALAKVRAARQEQGERIGDGLREVSEGIGLASDLFREFGDNVLADMLDKLANVANSVAGIVTGITSGNFLQAAGGIIGLVTQMFGGGKKDSKTRYERQIESLEGAIGRLGAKIDSAFGTEKIKYSTEQLEEYKKQIDAINDKIAELDALREKWETNRTSFDYLKFVGAGGYERLEDLKDDLAEVEAEYRNAINSLGEVLTGTTAQSITDSIIQGFRDGKRSVEDFASTFEDIMRDTMYNIFRNNFLAGRLQEFYEDLAEAADLNANGDQRLNAFEIMQLQGQFEDIIKDAQAEFELLNSLLETAGIGGFDTIDQRDKPGMSGAIQSITEDTANILEGYLNAVRIDVRAGLNIAIQSSQYLSQISANTYSSSESLKSIDNRIATIEGAIHQLEAQG